MAAGLLAWNFFIDVLNRSQTIYLDYANIIKKQNFPLMCLPMVVLALAVFDFFISFGLFTIYLIVMGEFPGWCYVGIVPILLLQAAYAVGLGTVLGICNIFFRDIGKAMVVFLQIWFWMTPIVYYMDTLPSKMQSFLLFNPLTPIMGAYQSILVKQEWPQWDSLFFPLILTVLLSGFFTLFYHQHAADLLDEL